MRIETDAIKKGMKNAYPRLLLVVILVFLVGAAQAQIWVGPKAGIQGSRFFFANEDDQLLYNEGFGLGWNAGWVANFDVVDGWSLATDYSFSSRG